MNRNGKNLTPEQALVKAESLCARTEYSRFEMLEKLKKWGLTRTEAESIIESLVERRFVDDHRFAAASVRDKYRFSGWGTRKIRQWLMMKRVPPEVIEEALQNIDMEEYMSVLNRFLATKAKSIKAETVQEFRNRLFAVALGRGFESGLIAVAMRNVRYRNEKDVEGVD